MTKRRYPESFVGTKINFLTIKEVIKQEKGGKLVKCFVCDCDCGNETTAIAEKVMREKTLSCGCHGHDQRLKSVLTHGVSKTPFYTIWAQMKKRCSHPENELHHRYAGRGITYQDSWESFEAFREDMSEGYAIGLELDRIDNDGNYTKENCRWVSAKQNIWNRFNPRGKSKYVGVCWHKGADKWSCSYSDNYLGLFEDELEAAKAYDVACLAERGEFAITNQSKYPEDFMEAA